MLFPSTTWLGGIAPLLGWVVILYAVVAGAIALITLVVAAARHILRAAHLGQPGRVGIALKNVTKTLVISMAIAILGFGIAVGVFYALIWLIVYQPLIALAVFVVLPLISRPIAVLPWRAIHRATSGAYATAKSGGPTEPPQQ